MQGSNRIDPSSTLKGTISVPPDKSISHRAALAALLSTSRTTVHHYLLAEDTLATLDAIRAYGARLERTETSVHIAGVGLQRAEEPRNVIDARNSGTLARIILGIAAGDGSFACFTGGSSLRRRAVGRGGPPPRGVGGALCGRAGCGSGAGAEQGPHRASIRRVRGGGEGGGPRGWGGLEAGGHHASWEAGGSGGDRGARRHLVCGVLGGGCAGGAWLGGTHKGRRAQPYQEWLSGYTSKDGRGRGGRGGTGGSDRGAGRGSGRAPLGAAGSARGSRERARRGRRASATCASRSVCRGRDCRGGG